jgi:S-DNA-T family DNA segregation ATPase FtsK/SpoIIIE
MRRRRRGRPRKFRLDFSLDPGTRKGIFTVFLFLAALLILLSIFGVAGSFGTAVDGFVSQIFGWDKLFVPFFLLAWGYHLVDSDKLPMNASNFIGFVMFFVGLNGLVHVVTFPGLNAEIENEALQAAAGKMGQLVAEPAISLLGFAGAAVLFAALLVASVLLMFNASLRTVLRVLLAVWKAAIRVLGLLLIPFKLIFRKKERQAESDVRTDEPFEEEIAEQEEEEDEEAENGAVPSPVQAAGSSPAPKRRRRRRVKIPVPLDLLARRTDRPTAGDIEYNKEVIKKTLRTFGIAVGMGDVSVGPTVTQFTFKPADGVKLTRITALHNDLALALAAHPIRIEAPIPKKSLVGVEVPNKNVALVGLREMFESRAYRERERKMSIPFALGKDVSGMTSIVDLSRMPHMLVAGATGAGKSVCLNILIMHLLYGHGPDDLKLILVDPKRVEFPVYNGTPHLITPVITKREETVNALKWTLREMDRRFDVLSKFGARDIASYNQQAADRMPYIVFIVDELADLMVAAGSEVEGPIVRLAQMARAVGIHLVLATQRPSVDVLTGLIKANIPARIAFSVASATDSRTILDQAGAEKLLGRGDMLYQTAEMSAPRRVQGAFVSDEEVRKVVGFLKSAYGPPDYESEVVESARGRTAFGGAFADEDSDPLLGDAMEEIIRAGKASASLLQRRLKVGYARAARLLDLLEREGMIGPGDGAKPREILKTKFASVPEIPVPGGEPEDEEWTDEEGEDRTSGESDAAAGEEEDAESRDDRETGK